MRRFEYLNCYLSPAYITKQGNENKEIDDKMNMLGAQGWEIVQIYERHPLQIAGANNKPNLYAVFKREIQEAPLF